MSSLRLRVLKSFRLLHRARQQVFFEDVISLEASQQKVNEEFKKNKAITDVAKIEELVTTAEESADFLKKMVVQAVKKEGEDSYALRVTRDTKLEDNAVVTNETTPPVKS